MQVDRIDKIESPVIYIASWFISDLSIQTLTKKKRNKKSISYRCQEEIYYFEDGEIKSKGYREYNITIRIDKILYSKIPYFTTREEAIEYLIDSSKYDLERARWKIKVLPKVISNLEKLKVDKDA